MLDFCISLKGGREGKVFRVVIYKEIDVPEKEIKIYT